MPVSDPEAAGKKQFYLSPGTKVLSKLVGVPMTSPSVGPLSKFGATRLCLLVAFVILAGACYLFVDSQTLHSFLVMVSPCWHVHPPPATLAQRMHERKLGASHSGCEALVVGETCVDVDRRTTQRTSLTDSMCVKRSNHMRPEVECQTVRAVSLHCVDTGTNVLMMPTGARGPYWLLTCVLRGLHPFSDFVLPMHDHASHQRGFIRVWGWLLCFLVRHIPGPMPGISSGALPVQANCQNIPSQHMAHLPQH